METLRYYPIIPTDFSGKELILPSPSVGASGNLAIDYLLNTIPHTLVGRIISPHFHPVAGVNCLDGPSLKANTGLEVYLGPKGDYVIL